MHLLKKIDSRLLAIPAIVIVLLFCFGLYQVFGTDEPMLDAAANGYVSRLQSLIEHGGNVNFKSDGGDTPIILAASNRHYEAAKLLMQHGADPTIKNSMKISAFDSAKSDPKMLRILRKQE